MTQEVLIPRMKKLDKRQHRIHIPILNIVMVLFAVLLLTGSTFINVNIRHFVIPAEIFSGNLHKSDFIYSFSIIPQIPVLMFICSCLGKKRATMTVILYFILGFIFLPVFALGGGFQYIGQYGCGYILAYLPAVIIAGSFLQRKYSFLSMFLAAVCGTLIIHICGILYMILIALIRSDGWNFIAGWISSQSGLKIIYDIIISFVLILIGKYINEFLKFVLK